MKNIEMFVIDNLPKALSNEEMHELFNKMKQGDKSSKDKLIEHNLRLVINQAKKYFINNEAQNKEYISVGIMGLIKAVNTFDNTKKRAFSTYAVPCINNEILMFLRKVRRIQEIDSLSRAIATDAQGNEITLEDIIMDDIDITAKIENNIQNKIIRDIVNNLPQRDRRIISMRFGFDSEKRFSQEEISQIFGLTQPTISRIITKNLKRIKIQLQRFEIIEKEHTKVKK